jgi:hypothetical protein
VDASYNCPPEFVGCDLALSSSQRGDGKVMKEHTEEWKNLCEQAAVEQDPVKLHQLIKQINDLLEAKEARLKGAPSNQSKEPG